MATVPNCATTGLVLATSRKASNSASPPAVVPPGLLTATIRPETYINLYIDKEWRPFIQTPPFPEYPSGHSVISSSAATMLAHMLGDNYAFTDSAEVAFGKPPKNFNSFSQAAREASMSRLYGGIHFLKSLNMGLEEGQNVAEYIVGKLEQP